MKCFGFNWRVGPRWGDAHPKHICWSDPYMVHYSPNSGLRLGVTCSIKDDSHQWGVGYVSSMETIKYGYVIVEFVLPRGRNLWPAIWLTDGKTWPPEIDIMEAWSGKKDYRKNLFSNEIFPSIHTGNSEENHECHSYKHLGGTGFCKLNIPETNTCGLLWTPDKVAVYYNSRKVMEETNPEILKWLNDSEGMEIHLNNYVTNDFTMIDYADIKKNEFVIKSLTYIPWSTTGCHINN